MMRPDDFRQLALRLPDAIESAHLNHPDFRVGGRIFATLGYPDDEWGVVKLTPEEQRRFVRADPAAAAGSLRGPSARGSRLDLLNGFLGTIE